MAEIHYLFMIYSDSAFRFSSKVDIDGVDHNGTPNPKCLKEIRRTYNQIFYELDTGVFMGNQKLCFNNFRSLKVMEQDQKFLYNVYELEISNGYCLDNDLVPRDYVANSFFNWSKRDYVQALIKRHSFDIVNVTEVVNDDYNGITVTTEGIPYVSYELFLIYLMDARPEFGLSFDVLKEIISVA
jgi:hypothetical protein